MTIFKQRCAGRRLSKSADGFALIISLALMSFVLLLLLSISTLVQVESKNSGRVLQQLTARCNAQLALQIALGQLQKHAGADQRVTSTSTIELVDPTGNVANAYWTGVWQQQVGATTRSPELLTWLVSGNRNGLDVLPTNPVVAPISSDSANVWLVENSVDTPQKQVKLPKQIIQVANGSTSGNFAWWVGDEGMKANVALVDPATTRPVEERIYSFQSAQRSGAEVLTNLAADYPANDLKLERLQHLNQLPLSASGGSAQNQLALSSKTLFHDITVNSAGVLADVAEGGLKKDLTSWLRGTNSPTAPLDTDFIFPPVGSDDYGLPKWGLIRSYQDISGDSGSVITRPQTDVSHGVYPVITYSFLGVSPSSEGDGMPFRVQLFPMLVLWNPFSVPISAGEFEIGIGMGDSNSPRIHFYQEETSKTYLATLHLSRGILNESETSSEGLRMFRFTVSCPDIPPGSSLVLSLADSEWGNEYVAGENVMVADALNPTGNSVMMTSASTVHFDDPSSPPVNDFFSWEMTSLSGGHLNAAIRLKPEVPDDPIGHEFEGNYLHLISRCGFGNQPDRTSLWQDEAISPEWRMRTEISMRYGASTIRAPWLAQQNFSAPESSRTPRDSGNNTGHIGLVGGVSTWPDTPIATAVVPSPSFPFRRASVGVSLNSPTGAATDVVLREFQPDGVPMTSIGQLTRVNLSALDVYPTWAVGNSLASYRVALDATSDTVGSYNPAPMDRIYDLSYLLNEALWDQYFFSSVPDDYSQIDLDTAELLPSARLHSTDEAVLSSLTGQTAFDEAASSLWVDGAFNVNSTSVDAWAAVLAGMNGLDYDPVTRSPGEVLSYPFSRYLLPDSSPNEIWDKTYRSLEQGQILELAQHIVDEVKARGPFLSMSDFVNRRLETTQYGFKGALQAAIDTQSADATSATIGLNEIVGFPTTLAGAGTSTNNYYLPQLKGGDTAYGNAPVAPWNSRFAFAPGYLTQGDILSSLGSILTARSDTFIIRTYGDVVSPVTGNVEAQAWHEAIVQRVPEYVDSSLNAWDQPTPSSINETFGRAFKVISTRWLTEQDI